jgi:flagellar assembly protein FliH
MEVEMNSSNQRGFSSSELELLNLWDSAEQFGKEKRPVTNKVKEEEKETLTVNDIESMQKQAYDEAFAQGKEEGYKQGVEEGKIEGKADGFKQGKLEGAKQGYEENSHLLQEQSTLFVRLLESLSEPFKELDETVEKELVHLAIGIASQLVRREIKIDSGQIIAVIREAINALPLASQKLTLHMHPEDAELVKSSLALDEISPPWVIIEDPLITQGGCKVQTSTSLIDATVENRLAAIVATVLGGEREEDKPL